MLALTALEAMASAMAMLASELWMLTTAVLAALCRELVRVPGAARVVAVTRFSYFGGHGLQGLGLDDGELSGSEMAPAFWLIASDMV